MAVINNKPRTMLHPAVHDQKLQHKAMHRVTRRTNMLPHRHYLIAAAVIAPMSALLFPARPPKEISEWVLVGGFLSAAIDLDKKAT